MRSRPWWYRIAAATTTAVALAALVLGAYGQLDTTVGAPATTDTLSARPPRAAPAAPLHVDCAIHQARTWSIAQ